MNTTQIEHLYASLARRASYCKKDTVVIYQNSFYSYMKGDIDKAIMLLDTTVPNALQADTEKLLQLIKNN